MTDRPDALELAQRVRPAMTSLYVAYFRNTERSDLTGPQLSILRRLEVEGPSRISHIATSEGVRMPTASNTINQLEKRGLVHRTRSAEDRRGVLVDLTEQGKHELIRVGKERTQYLADMLATLDDASLQQLDAATDAIVRLAEVYANPET